MKTKNVLYSPHFVNAFKKMPIEIQKLAVVKEKIFTQNCFDPRLKTHKLKGHLKEYWAFSVNYSIRILFNFQENNEVVFMDIGPHSIYK